MSASEKERKAPVPSLMVIDEESDPTTLPRVIGKKPMLIKIVSPTCGYCTGMIEDWNNLRWEGLPSDLVLASVDAQQVHQLPQELGELTRSQGVPTIVFLHPGGQWAEHKGGRTTAEMAKFVKTMLGKRNSKRGGAQAGGRTRRRTRRACAQKPGPGCRWHRRRRRRMRRRSSRGRKRTRRRTKPR